jgi:hypothetical protein
MLCSALFIKLSSVNFPSVVKSFYAPLASLRNLVTLELTTRTVAVEMAPLSQLLHLTTLELGLFNSAHNLSVYVLAPLADIANLTALDLSYVRTRPTFALPADLILFIGSLRLQSLTLQNPLAVPGTLGLRALKSTLQTLKLVGDTRTGGYRVSVFSKLTLLSLTSHMPAIKSLRLIEHRVCNLFVNLSMPTLENMHVAAVTLGSILLEALAMGNYPQLRRLSLELAPQGFAGHLRTLVASRSFSQLAELKIDLRQAEMRDVCTCYYLDCLNELRSLVLQFPNATLRLPFLWNLLYDNPNTEIFAEEHPECAVTIDSESCLANLVPLTC